MKRVLSAVLQHPQQQFRRHRHFYLAYDATYAVVCAALVALKFALGLPAIFARPTLGWLALVPLTLYAVVIAHLSIHNAVHGNFPRAYNRVLGEVLGFFVVVRFASWTMVHLRHHRYTDHCERDPHPTFPSFWKTVTHTVVNVEAQLMRECFDRWGDTAANRAAETFRAKVSYATNVLVLAAWLAYLGPWFFALVFVPANVFGALFIMHFNWSTHNGPRGGDFGPVNLNHGYYWLGNKIFAGIYMHKNHHDRPYLANPASCPVPHARAEREFGPKPVPLPHARAERAQAERAGERR
jgi:stearoyl-CoA desaturase (delta-9 desaturase)